MASDITYDVFQHYGTNAERTAFTPAPAAGIQPIYIWYETDTGNSFLYDTSWHSIAGPSGSIPTTAQGDILYASAANTLSALAKNATATRYLSNTGATNNPAWAQVALTTGVSGTLPVGNGGTGTTSAPKVYSATFSFTNAQIKALPSTYLEVVAAPGATQFLVFHYAAFYIDATAGAYTNVDAGFLTGFAITYGDWVEEASSFAPWGGTSIGAHLSTIQKPVNNTTGNFIFPVFGPSPQGTTNFKLISWNDPGDFTGGNASNTLKGSVAYSIFDYSTGLFV
jgi:hypothetical protein